jgi:hypothetical protein
MDENGQIQWERQFEEVMKRAEKEVDRQERAREEEMRRIKAEERNRERLERRKRLEEAEMKEDIQDIVKPDSFRKVKKVMSEIEVLMLEVSAARVWQVPPFNAETDLLPLILQIINGAFGTFPYESMAFYCKTNTTSILPTAQVVYDTFTDSWESMK